MYIRFQVQLDMAIADLGQMIFDIGNPALTFSDYYFYADVPAKYRGKLKELKQTGVMLGLRFLPEPHAVSQSLFDEVT